jgi:hypothetical protein
MAWNIKARLDAIPNIYPDLTSGTPATVQAALLKLALFDATSLEFMALRDHFVAQWAGKTADLEAAIELLDFGEKVTPTGIFP